LPALAPAAGVDIAPAGPKQTLGPKAMGSPLALDVPLYVARTLSRPSLHVTTPHPRWGSAGPPALRSSPGRG